LHGIKDLDQDIGRAQPFLGEEQTQPKRKVPSKLVIDDAIALFLALEPFQDGVDQRRQVVLEYITTKKRAFSFTKEE
jgi:hypothetical protein